MSKFEKEQKLELLRKREAFTHLLDALRIYREDRAYFLGVVFTKEAELAVALLQVILDQQFARETWEEAMRERMLKRNASSMRRRGRLDTQSDPSGIELGRTLVSLFPVEKEAKPTRGSQAKANGAQR